MMQTTPTVLTDPTQIMARIAVNSTRTNLTRNVVNSFNSYFSSNTSTKPTVPDIKKKLDELGFKLLGYTNQVAIVLAIMNIKYPVVTNTNFEYRVAAKVTREQERNVRMFVNYVLNKVERR